MGSDLKIRKFRLGGMTCINCQKKIEKKLQSTTGIQKAEIRYSTGTAVITYDTDILSPADIDMVIQKLGYQVLAEGNLPAPDFRRILGLLIIIIAIYMVMEHFGLLNFLMPSRLAESSMGSAMLFVLGLLTSVHCIAMCGGINLSQCIPLEGASMGQNRLSTLRPSFLYNLGRVVSYTFVGFLAGALGSAITFSVVSQGILKLIAGLFMVSMGINMLGLFPWFRRFQPSMPKIFAKGLDTGATRGKGPLFIGLLNGLMPCGPLQTMQIYALSTGSPLSGALSMLLFSLGTVPLPFGFGALGSLLSRRFTAKAMTAGAILVAALGLSIFSQGWVLSGFAGDMPGVSSSLKNNVSENTMPLIEDGVQIVNSKLSRRAYPAIAVQAGTPVKWIIDAPQGSISGCNDTMIIPEYGIEYSFKPGENIIEFTPGQSGTFQYSCWMGMIRSTITVTGGVGSSQTPTAQNDGSSENDPSAVRALSAPLKLASCYLP